MTGVGLVVFGGLPGVGKTTLARQAAHAWGAVFLRVDTVEQALLAATPGLGEAGPSGYMIARAVALDNLALGLDVVVDCVNPLRVTRDKWRSAAAKAQVALHEIEIVCSDPVEHRRRVETRQADISGHRMPTWSDVISRQYEPWDRAHLVVDTGALTEAEALDVILRAAQNSD